MDALLNAGTILLPLVYLLVALDYGGRFFLGRSLTPRSAQFGLRIALVLHILFLIGLTVRWHQLPAANVTQALSIVALSIVIVYVWVEWRTGESSTGFWMVSLAFVFLLLSSLVAGPEPVERELFANPYFATHVSMALLGYAAFAVAAGYGFLYLRLYHELKASTFSNFFGKLPPLEVLERMMSGALLVGFVALTLSVLVGVYWASQILHESWIDDPKIVTTLATWLLYAGALVLRYLRHWKGRQVAYVSLAGLVAVLFSIFAVNLWFSDFHSFL